MTRPSLAGIEHRTAAATEGPWEAHEGTVGAMTGPRGCGGCSGLVSPRHEPARFWSEVAGAAPADAEFIADARTAVPALTAAVRDVLALHREDRDFCRDCDHAYPCPTLRALTAHLDLTDPEGDPT